MTIDGSRTRSFLEREGEPATIYTYSLDTSTTDDYGDPAESSDTTSSQALFEWIRQPQRRMTASGEEIVVNARIFVPNDVAAEIRGHAPSDDPEAVRPSEIVREDTGRRFEVVAPFDEGNGSIRCDCRDVGFD